MIEVRFRSSGEIWQILDDPENVPIPTEVVHTLEFDAATNLLLYDDIRAQQSAYFFNGTNLLRNGETVIINPPGADETWRQRATQSFSLIDDDSLWETATNAQKLEALRRLIRFAVRSLARRGLLGSEFRGAVSG